MEDQEIPEELQEAYNKMKFEGGEATAQIITDRLPDFTMREYLSAFSVGVIEAGMMALRQSCLADEEFDILLALISAKVKSEFAQRNNRTDITIN